MVIRGPPLISNYFGWHYWPGAGVGNASLKGEDGVGAIRSDRDPPARLSGVRISP